MSDYENHRGRLELFRRQENETDKNYTQRLFEKLGEPFTEEDWAEHEDDIREFLSWQNTEEKVFYVNNKYYLNVDHKELDPYDDIQELEGNDEEGYTYYMRFYNGGTCLNEMIEEAFEK